MRRQSRKFFQCHGYELNLENPRSYNEKIVWRKIYDRNPLFPILSDKYRSREFVIERLGKEAGEKILVPLLFVTGNPEEIPFGDLPEEYIIKPNHGSGSTIIVDSLRPAYPDRIIPKCRKWLVKIYGQSKLEWAYSQIKPLIMIERLLKDRIGRFASDFKFHVFGGKVEWVFVMHDRFEVPSTARYDRNFKRMANSAEGLAVAQDIPKPDNFEEMVEIAEKLALSLDYLRVDLYNVDGDIFFGEFTVYPASGLNRFDKDFDLDIGARWDLNRE